MGPMMYPVLIGLCVGIVYCEDKPVTVNPVPSVTPASSNSTSSVLIENKVQNLTVQYSSDHGKNRTNVFSPSASNQTTEKPLIITTSKERRVIKTPSLNDSIVTTTAPPESNSTQRHPNEMKHHGRANVNKSHSSHFLPTIKPESSPNYANLSRFANPSKPANLTSVVIPKGSAILPKNQNNSADHNGYQHPHRQNPQKHPVQRHVQNTRFQHLNHQLKSPKDNVGHASEIEMHKVEVKEMRYMEAPKENKKFRYYMAGDENTSRPVTSSQTFEVTFSSKLGQKNPLLETKQMDKYKVRSKPYYDNQNHQDMAKGADSTGAPLQYMTPPPPIIYTVRPRIHNVNNISITTAAPPNKFDATHQMIADVHPHSGPRDFSCLRCSGHNKQPKNYQYPTYTSTHDPILEGNRAVKFFGQEGDNLLGASKHHYVVAKPDPPKNATTINQKGQVAKKRETLINQGKQNLPPKRPETSAATEKHNTTARNPGHQNPKPQGAFTKTRNPYVLMDGLGSYASPNVKRPGEFTVPQKPMDQTFIQKGNWSTQIHGVPMNQISKPVESLSTKFLSRPQIRNPYIKNRFSGNNFATSNLEFSLSKPSLNGPSSQFKLDPSSGLYNLDEELQASASVMHKHHPDVQVETKEIHIPIPQIVETRVPYPIHIKVDRPVAVHIDKPYPVHIEKKVPVPVKINVPQPYPVEKEVPYPVKIPIEVPRPVEVAKPVPYLVEHPVPVQVFKHVKFPVKVPVDLPVPYKVQVEVEKRVPYFVEKKVPFEVPVPVEKPYLVEVKKPFDVPQEKPYPVTVEKKIPVPVQVVQFVEVPVPVRVPHEHQGYQNHHHVQHVQQRSGEDSDQNDHSSEQGARLVKISIGQNHQKSSSDQSQSSANRHARMEVVLPDTISVEFPTGYGRQPPSNSVQPTASSAQT